ncbi:MAG: radical SAM family heme chaperone HemW [Gemmatimonadota bacterium]|nr:radical SAM family heme chaperone HemW [Gemmatimonadota bacterium]
MLSRPRHLYVHVPFCARRCAYCDFSIAVRGVIPEHEYAAAVGAELARRFPSGEPWELDTLYFGGGTPSKLGGAGVARLVDALRARVSLAPGAEVTLEANPEDVTPPAAAAWRAAGVNRISLGAQSFDDRVLTWMHRTHDAAAIPRAVNAARDAGFDDLSLDLIFALPEGLPRDWDRDLAAAVALAPTHLSLYGLTVEPATPLGRWFDRGQVGEAPEERYEREFLAAHDALGAHGFEHYEVSNYSLPGREARHNAAYWQRVPYVGVGPSAHGFEDETRRWNESAYAAWMARVEAGQDPVAGTERISGKSRTLEEVYLGLRTARGLHLSPGEAESLQSWLDAGWGTVDPGGTLRLTAAGWLRMDALTKRLTDLRSRY